MKLRELVGEGKTDVMVGAGDHVGGHHQYDGGAEGLGGEASCHHPTMRRVIDHDLYDFA
jgi:hypothetical protein